MTYKGIRDIIRDALTLLGIERCIDIIRDPMTLFPLEFCGCNFLHRYRRSRKGMRYKSIIYLLVVLSCIAQSFGSLKKRNPKFQLLNDFVKISTK